MHLATWRSAAVAVALVPLMTMAVSAQPADAEQQTESAGDEPVETRPWYVGVGEQAKAAAQQSLDAGNQSFLENKYREALRHYQDATAHWDHPAIHFNVVRALIKLDRTIEAYESLERALKYGAAPFGKPVYAEALNYQQLLRSQIATIEVTCKQDGAQITLNGDDFLRCPGHKAVRVRPGRHQLVGELEGHLTKKQEVFAVAQKTEKVAIALLEVAEATVMKRRWPAWKPWAVVGGGAAVALGGAFLRWRGSSNMDNYHRLVEAECPPPEGCRSPELLEELDDKRDSAQLLGRAGIATLSAGGAVMVAGTVLLFLNRERPVLDENAANPPVVTASVTSSRVGLDVSLRF